jgi:hypothetical protein
MLVAGGAAAVLALVGVGYAAAHGGGFGHGPGARLAESNGTVTGRFLDLSVDLATGTLSNVDATAANGTRPYVVALQLAGRGDNGSVTRGAYVLRDDARDEVAVADAPGLDVAMSSPNGTTVTMTLPADAIVVTHDAVARWSPAGATVTYANGEVANLVLSPQATVTQTGQTLTLTLPAHGHASYALLHARGGGPGAVGGGVGHDGFGHEGFGRGRAPPPAWGGGFGRR